MGTMVEAGGSGHAGREEERTELKPGTQRKFG